jgi:hypothetical protein
MVHHFQTLADGQISDRLASVHPLVLLSEMQQRDRQFCVEMNLRKVEDGESIAQRVEELYRNLEEGVVCRQRGEGRPLDRLLETLPNAL